MEDDLPPALDLTEVYPALRSDDDDAFAGCRWTGRARRGGVTPGEGEGAADGRVGFVVGVGGGGGGWDAEDDGLEGVGGGEVGFGEGCEGGEVRWGVGEEGAEGGDRVLERILVGVRTQTRRLERRRTTPPSS